MRAWFFCVGGKDKVNKWSKSKGLKKDTKWLKKCSKGLKIEVKKGSQPREKLAAK